MKRWWTVLLLGAGLWLAPALAAAQPPPPDQQGGSPEPAAALLLLAGSVPAVALYRRVRRAETPSE